MNELEELPTPRTILIIGVLLMAALLMVAWLLDARADAYRAEQAHRHWVYVVQPATVEGWMTFDYLNRVFMLPPSYLVNTLDIEDPRYPNISIEEYAAIHGLNPILFLSQVRSALATSTPASAP